MIRISKWSLVFALTLVGAALPLASCESTPSPQSDLIRRFNLGAIVERVGARQLHGGTVAASYSNSPGETTTGEWGRACVSALIFKEKDPGGARAADGVKRFPELCAEKQDRPHSWPGFYKIMRSRAG